LKNISNHVTKPFGKIFLDTKVLSWWGIISNYYTNKQTKSNPNPNTKTQLPKWAFSKLYCNLASVET
jgi:hypothetical protein